jgi:thiol:disulfide interchange protein DsbD
MLLNPGTERVLATPQGADYEPANFQAFLGSGLQAFRSGMPQ